MQGSGAVTQFVLRLALIALLTFIVVRVIFILHSHQPHKHARSPAGSASALSAKDGASSVIGMPPGKSIKAGINFNSTKQVKKRVSKPLFEWDNTISRVGMRWGDFVKLPQQTFMNKGSISSSTLSMLSQCPTASAVNASGNICMNVWNDRYLSLWKGRQVKDLCESNANSKIQCFDSPKPKSRYCIFENAMMNFRKVRKRKSDGQWTRSWEKGFLSADCGDMAPDDIGYLGLYKPDIEGRDDAVCDVVFNETVVLYSHENSRSYYAMANDFLNLWTSLWLSGAARYSKDVSLLNLDSVKKGKFFGDQPNHFFKIYNATMRRVLKGAEFLEPSPSKVCFKRLVVQPRPLLAFTRVETNVLLAVQSAAANTSRSDGSASSLLSALPALREEDCAQRALASSLFQRWNLHVRSHLHLLPNPYSAPAQAAFNVVFITRSASSKYHRQVDHYHSRIVANQAEVVAALRMRLSTHNSSLTLVHVVEVDLLSLPFEEQLQVIASAHLMVGMHSSVIATSILHMSVGNPRCCAVVELFPGAANANANPATKQGYAHLARNLGHQYERFDLLVGDGVVTNSSAGSVVPADLLSSVVDRLAQRLLQGEGSCLLPGVAKSPFL